jgi:hypothetical protein
MSLLRNPPLSDSNILTSNSITPLLLPTMFPLPNPTTYPTQSPTEIHTCHCCDAADYTLLLTSLQVGFDTFEADRSGIKTQGQFWSSRSEPDVSMFLCHNPPADDCLNQSQEYAAYDLSSSSQVGSLSAGFAGITMAPHALLNRESAHQAPRRRDQIFDSSRGLVGILPV